jgi:hypothetical protein
MLTCLRSILILSSHLCLGLPGGFLLLGFPIQSLYAPLLYPIRATCPTHLRRKYPPQHPILLNPQTTFLPQRERPSFTTT